jgi:ankyrin repeat protein
MHPFAPHLPTTPSAQPHPYPTPPSPANITLANAIQFASQQELPKLVDRAMKSGATLNSAQCYECNALVMAVRANRPWAISVLMARGATLPPAPPDGITLLMEACRDDLEVVVDALLDVAKVSPHDKDANGNTALHYALIAKSEQIVAELLRAGADPNLPVPPLKPDEYLSLLGHDLPSVGQLVTPLMIAAAIGSETMVAALLNAEANPNSGSYSPLIIAANQRHTAIFDLLLANGADLNHCRIPLGNLKLAACVASRMPVAYLSKLVSQHDFSDDSGTVHSPLGIALSLGDTSVIAFLIASGAPIEEHEESAEPLTLWDLALPPEKLSSTAVDLLTARDPAIFVPSDEDHVAALLVMIAKNATKPPVIASRGIFTSLLVRCIDHLRELSPLVPTLVRRQCALIVALRLKNSMPKLAMPQERSRTNPPSRDDDWFKTTAQRLRLQSEALLDGSNKLVNHCMESLQKSITLDFFLRCAEDCSVDESIASFIKHRLAEATGAPDPVIRLVRDAWIMAAKWTKDWQVSPDSSADGNRFLVALAQNLMRKALDEFTGDHDDVTNICLRTLRQALPIASHELSKFCADPAAWLRQFENRLTLDDPADTLSDRLQITLGLPAATCEAITSDWRNALRNARTAQWSTPAELQRVLKRTMALNMGRALHAGDGDKIVPATSRLMLERTRSDVMSSPSPHAPSRKRPAEAEAPDAPPRKEARDTETS